METVVLDPNASELDRRVVILQLIETYGLRTVPRRSALPSPDHEPPIQIARGHGVIQCADESSARAMFEWLADLGVEVALGEAGVRVRPSVVIVVDPPASRTGASPPDFIVLARRARAHSLGLDPK